MILIQLRKERGNLPLAERIVKRVVNSLGGDSESRCRDAIDDEHRLRAARLLVGRDVAQLRKLLQFVHERCRPCVQFLRVGIFQRVLILSAADAVLDRQILDRLHKKRDPINLFELRLQPAHHFGRAGISFFQRLEVDKDPPAVQRRVYPIDTDE